MLCHKMASMFGETIIHQMIAAAGDGVAGIASGNLTFGIIVSAALADSINPCVIGVLVFLMLFLSKAFKSRTRMLVAGIFYTVVVYATYLALGFGILRVAVSVGFSEVFYWIAAIIAILAGLLEMKDFFAYGKGFTLQMLPGGGDRLRRYTARIEQIYATHPNWSMVFIGLLGIFVVMVELPCTGAPYFAVLALLAHGDYATAVPYLLIYNLIFVIPLFVVVALGFFGRGQAMDEWRLRHRGAMRLIIGLFLIALGGYMIYSLYAVG